MVLADSSVWIDHFRKPQSLLPQLIASNKLTIHPFIIGELALGSVPDRAKLLSFLQTLPALRKTGQDHWLEFVAAHELHGKGIGFVDAHLLSSCAENRDELWTRDKRLADQALCLGLAYQP